MKLLLAFIILAATSCNEKKSMFNTTDIVIDGMYFRILTIDNCEYIMSGGGGTVGFLSHKGNCKFCEQRKIR